MASENVEDWDQPLPSPAEEQTEESNDGLTYEDRRHNENMDKLKVYVEQMSYVPVKPPAASPYTEMLAKPTKRRLVENAKVFANVMEPRERGDRLKRLASKFTTITTEQLEEDIRANKVKDRQREDIQKRKQEVYYEMLNKLERQCRSQYLNVLINKFANFIAKLATTMRIPPTLVDPYARMQRGIFCNILLAIGVQPTSQAAIYYNTKEGSEYEVCHKLSHALLSLIIKALDSASTRNAEDMHPIEADFEMDNYIKDRLMCAAEKKVQNIPKTRNEGVDKLQDLSSVFVKCKHVRYKPCK